MPETASSFELTPCRCEIHGAYEAYRAAGTVMLGNDCPRCIDAAEARKSEERRQANEKRRRAVKLDKIIEDAGIPPRFADRSLASYRTQTEGQRRALTICRAYTANWENQLLKGGSLVLTGNVGTGKTHLACAIANAIMPHMATVLFGTVSKLLRSVMSTYGRNSDRSEKQALDDLRKPDLLIIDEVGVQNGSDHELKLLFEILNERYQYLRPTILISNLNTEDLRKFLGVRVMDRFAESGHVVAFDWSSHRGTQQDLV